MSDGVLYSNSKRWEELEKSILWVVKKYCPPQSRRASERVDVSSFYPDLGLSPSMIQEMVVEECKAEAVVTIENLTSFYQYVYDGPDNHLVIYLGGYHNRPRRLILTKIWEFFKAQNSPTPFYHWGDMDLGGFRIWNHLCQKTGISVKPLMMDEETYLGHISRGQIMDDGYLKKLAELLENPSYGPLHRLIYLMLEKGIKIEQETVNIYNNINIQK
ncbi:MAG: DUF2399 domain-containing protein [Clostridiales bacterium]|jgi:hypothetical protein|nr:DUF2399 domain-containing protein [Clostridiales bacterium]